MNEKEFAQYLSEIEKADYNGSDISYSLSADASSLDKAKYQICEKILAYQQDNNLSPDQVANKIQLTTAETKDILHYHLSLFTLDRLMTYAERLLAPIKEIQLIITEKRSNLHV